MALTAGDRGGNSVSVNGSRTNETDYQLDGMRFAGSYTNSGLNYPSPDALQEFKLITNSYSAEYGYYAGSIFTAVTRAGTNQIHGAAWEFLRNDKLNARNFFSFHCSHPPAESIWRQRRISPLRTSCLASFRTRDCEFAVPPSPSSFPLTEGERQGVFQTTIRDPQTNLPFPNNTIPASRINPVSRRLLNDIIPVAPSGGSGQLVTSGSNPIDGNHYLGKLDAILSSKDSLSVSYFFDKTYFRTPFASGPYPVYGQREEDQVVPVASVSYTRSITSTLLNQLRTGISGQEENRGCSSGLTPRDLGINMDLEGPPEPPNVNVTGRFNIGERLPYSQRFWVQAPHPGITRDRLREILVPAPGERVLEIGPGTGYYTLDLAEWVRHEGSVEVFDLQQEMLDHTIRGPANTGSGTSIRPGGTHRTSPTRTTPSTRPC